MGTTTYKSIIPVLLNTDGGEGVAGEVNEQVVHHLTMPLDTLKPFSDDDGHNHNDVDDNLMMMIKMIIIITKKAFRSP